MSPTVSFTEEKYGISNSDEKLSGSDMFMGLKILPDVVTLIPTKLRGRIRGTVCPATVRMLTLDDILPRAGIH